MYREKYEEWLDSDIISEEIKTELRDVKKDKEVEDGFYKELDFGTGGLRSAIGAGTNRTNIYTVGKATQGFADYLNDNYAGEESVTVAYDSRNISKEFTKAAALTLCANGIKVNPFESLRPTPMLSLAVRELNCKGGIVITASHNPKRYNEYKVYEDDGCQLTDVPAKAVTGYVNKVTDYANIKTTSEEKALEGGLSVYIGEEIDKEYIDDLKTLTTREDLAKRHAKDLKIIYTPIHGSGNAPVRKILRELGYENIFAVKEQEMPDGDPPTASYPNPEDPRVFKLALDMAKEIQPDIIFGTDPDYDRVGVVVKDSNGEYQVSSGNQTGILLTNYILSSLKEMNKLSRNGAVIKTIVTTESVRKMTEEYGVALIDILAGFKYIGEEIRKFEESGLNEYLSGFEENYGYLVGISTRDKDAVVASMLIAETTLYYKEQGKTLYDGSIELYNKYGYFKESPVSIELVGKEGQEQITKCIDGPGNDALKEIDGVGVTISFDYKLSKEINNLTGEEKEIKLSKLNVLKYVLEDDSWFVVRLSGTEPKMKIYLPVKGSSLEDPKEKTENFKDAIMEVINAKLK